MDDVIVMHVLNGMTDLFDDDSYFFLSKIALAFEMLIEISLCTELHQKIKIIVLYKN